MKIEDIGLLGYSYPVSNNITRLDTNAHLIAVWLKDNWPERFTIAGTGTSGVLIAAFVARHFPLSLVTVSLIRKPREQHHDVEVNLPGYGPILIVDDIISTGMTLTNIKKSLTSIGRIDAVTALCIPQLSEPDIKLHNLKHLFPNLETLLS